MSCISPLIGIPMGFSENGKMRYMPMKRDIYNGDFYKSKEYLKIKTEIKDDKYYPPIEIPCGKCIGCRLDYSKEWAIRCMMELKYHEKACFVTFTYSEKEAHISYFSDEKTGEAIPVLSLEKKDLQDFWKRLRSHLHDRNMGSIRYFACGEYGSQTWRPHYHAIIFGYFPDDVVVDKKIDDTVYWTSKELNKLWSHGNCLIAKVTFNTCAYVARYTAKKVNGTLGKEFYEKFNIQAPFLVMSRRPGIGWQYLDEHHHYFEINHIYISGQEPVDGKIPRAFYRKLESIDKELFEEVKRNKEKAGNAYERAIIMASKVPYSKRLKDAEENLVAISKSIVRNKL